MRGKKITLLFLGLLLPVLVFIFLKFFGENQFEVPLLYVNGVGKIPSGCSFNYNRPYLIPDSVVKKFRHAVTPLVLVNFGKNSGRLQEILDPFSEKEIELLDGPDAFGKEELSTMKKCIFLTEAPSTLVLIDKENNIRGHYNGNDRDDMDRLRAEVSIILKKY